MKVLKNLRYVQLDCKASDSNIDRFEICFTSALASIFPTGSPHDRSLGAFDLLPTYWGREANNLWTPALLPADTDAVSCEVEFRIMMQALSESGVNLLFFEMSFKRVAPPIKLFSNTHQFQSGSPLYRQVSNVLHNLTSLQLRMQMNPGDEESILEEARLDLLLNSAPNLLRLELWVRHVDEMKRTLPLRNTGLTKPTCVPKLSSLSLYGFTGSTDDLVDTLARRRLTHLDLYEFFCDQNDSDYSAPSGCEGFKEHEISRLMPIFAAIPCLGGTLAYGDDGAYLYILQYQKHNYVNRPEIYRPFAQECYPGEEDRARKFPDWVDPNTPFVVCDCSPDLRLDRDLLKYSLSQKRWFNFRY
ncbi:hypothetical protein MMC25_007978 [Agyrium rufum]|nr:hypothetical protein [Agyrium rufum]